MPTLTLPIWDAMSGILSSLQEGKNVVVAAPPGSGKTTQVPQAILQAGILMPDEAIIVVQPRKVACRAAARRVADELGVELGKEVGYVVRGERCFSRGTKICFLTDGMLLVLLQQRVLRASRNIVVLDEIHERRATGDLVLGLLRHQQLQGSKMKLVAMSATIDTELVANYLEADTVVAHGRSHPLTIKYVMRRPLLRELPSVVAEHILEHHKDTEDGDLLVFLPGKAEIQKTTHELKRRGIEGATILPLHSELSAEFQDRVFHTVAGRKIVLATNIAETSLTVPGITSVIDTGYERRSIYDHEIGASRLVLHQISKASAEQRAGRAARMQTGTCLRLWSEEEQMRLELFTPPEIQRTDVASVMLNLRVMGIKQAEDFPFLEAPHPDQVMAAERLLSVLGATDQDGDITPLGRRMFEFPLSPRHARMVIEAERLKCLESVAGMVAVLEGPFIFAFGARAQIRACIQRFTLETASDLFAHLRILEQSREHAEDDSWFEQNGLDPESLAEVRRIKRSILRTVARSGGKVRGTDKPENIIRCIVSGLPDRYAKRAPNGKYVLLNGQQAAKDMFSVTQREEVVAASVRIVSSTVKDDEKEVTLSLLTEVNIGLMRQLAPTLFAAAPEKIRAKATTAGFNQVRERFGHLDGIVAKLLKPTDKK